MSGWLIALIVFAVLFVMMEIRNRKQRPLFEQVEKENAALLEGRFQSNPVLRRRFMRALVRYCFSDGFDQTALALAVNADRMAVNDEDRAACALLIAFNLERRGDYAEAIDLYDTVIAIEPDNMIALSRKARALGALQEEDCVEAFEEVIRREPDDAVWRNNYGSALLRIKRFEEAEVQLRKAIELDGSMLSARELLVLALSGMESDGLEAAMADAAAHGSDPARMKETIAEFRKNIMEE